MLDPEVVRDGRAIDRSVQGRRGPANDAVPRGATAFAALRECGQWPHFSRETALTRQEASELRKDREVGMQPHVIQPPEAQWE